MPKPFQSWTVLPHQPIEKITARHWRVAARMPGAPIDRMMNVVRLADGRLVIHNGIALDDRAMKELEGWGTPAFLIVPNGMHRMDARIYKDRYPSLKVVAPPGAKAKVEEVVGVDLTSVDFGDPDVAYGPLDGTREREGVLAIRGPDATLIFTDALMNLKSLPGFGGFMMGLAGFTGPQPKVTLPARMMLVADKQALRAHFERLAETDGLSRLEVGHGAPVTSGAAEALRAAAARL